ncbi:MAG: glycoside hydrolase family 15 protein [Bradymonadaceae bacterium]
MMRPWIAREYAPIEDYAVIGNLRTMALVARDGSIDWCCLPHLDSPSVFGALLDARRGGRFLVRTLEMRACEQRYHGRTNVLITSQEGPRGRLEILDFMPLDGDLHGRGHTTSAPEIYRRLFCDSGQVEVLVEWSPRWDYGRAPMEFHRVSGGVVASDGVQDFALGGLPVPPRVKETLEGPTLCARFVLEQGDSIGLVTRHGDDPRLSLEALDSALERTFTAWLSWIKTSEERRDRSWAGPWKESIIRSELVLKLLTHDQTGAIAAAATASLPETIGGVRNWDYRFAWIRDAAQIARAFFALGHVREVDDFVYWAEHVSMEQEKKPGGLRILHPLRPETPLEEIVLERFEGYRRSQPVHIGNEAADQLQLDIYGELFNAVYERVCLEGHFDRDVSQFLSRLADDTVEHWMDPDYGIWEVRHGPFHFVYSKLMSWVALDRAIRLHGQGLIQGDVSQWRAHLIQIRDWILRAGFDADRRTFLRTPSSPALDATGLLFAPMGFIDFEDPRFQGTIDATLKELTMADLVYRYRTDDGLPGEEGAFVLCTFWLVDALALSGRIDEAYRVYENLMGRLNHVGLFSEEIDPSSGIFLGNFPQAYSHVGMINSALNLASVL